MNVFQPKPNKDESYLKTFAEIKIKTIIEHLFYQ